MTVSMPQLNGYYIYTPTRDIVQSTEADHPRITGPVLVNITKLPCIFNKVCFKVIPTMTSGFHVIKSNNDYKAFRPPNAEEIAEGTKQALEVLKQRQAQLKKEIAEITAIHLHVSP